MTFFRSSSAAVSSEKNLEQNILLLKDIPAVRSDSLFACLRVGTLLLINAITVLIHKYGEVTNLARKDIKSNAQMWMPPPAASQIKISSMNISQTTSGQHIPARKANRSPPFPFASCATFLNATTLLNPSTAEQIPKDQKSNNPCVASCWLG
jgi:hypothetical protein